MISTQTYAAPDTAAHANQHTDLHALNDNQTALIQQHFLLIQLVIALLVISIGSSCTSKSVKQSRSPPSSPNKEFIAKGVLLEEKRAGKLIWSGSANEAQGDLKTIQVKQVTLVHHPQKIGDTTLTVSATSALLALRDGHAEFTKIQVVDEQGGKLTAPHAIFIEKTHSISTQGPVHLTSQQLTARSKSATVHLDSGMIKLNGPIEATIRP